MKDEFAKDAESLMTVLYNLNKNIELLLKSVQNRKADEAVKILQQIDGLGCPTCGRKFKICVIDEALSSDNCGTGTNDEELEKHFEC